MIRSSKLTWQDQEMSLCVIRGFRGISNTFGPPPSRHGAKACTEWCRRLGTEVKHSQNGRGELAPTKRWGSSHKSSHLSLNSQWHSWYYGQETEAQRGQAICCRHTISKWLNCDEKPGPPACLKSVCLPR